MTLRNPRPGLGSALLLAVLVLPLLSGAAEAQDVELLGRIHGTRPPDAYYRELARNPDAFQFREGVWRNRLLALRSGEADGAGDAGMSDIFRRGEGAVEGTFHMPLILGLYSDSPENPPYEASRVHEEFFAGPNSRYRTITEFYREISGGRVELLGETFPWQRVELTRAEVAGGASGLGSNSARVGEYIVQTLSRLDDGTVDWGRYDNDGPDGVPNSGDDDGYVDVLAVMHPTHGAECGEGRDSDYIWSHRWVISAWVGSPYVTESPSANGGRIRINDYTIQPVRSCDGASINEIGVFAHELGHGFGLPDLYDTNSSDGSHGAAGRWSLMATGSWGCGFSGPAYPCHMNAWSKSILGWVELDTLDTGSDHGRLDLGPVEEGGRVLWIPAGDGSGEYFLLENRQRIGFDQDLLEPGLLVWQIDPEVIAAPGGVNADPDHMGVWLRQADGLNDLGRNGGGSGDAGDPFPGATGNTVFHAGSNPGSWSHDGSATGVTLLEIGPNGLRIELRALTRFQELDLRVEGLEDVEDPEAVFTVDGDTLAGTSPSVPSAPFQERTVEAAPGVPVSQGIRTGFTGWEDGSDRVRTFETGLEDSTLVASYGEREVLLAIAIDAPVEEIAPGELVFDPVGDDGWYSQGTVVEVEARSRTGFSFREWTGDLAGESNPALVTLDEPRSGTAAFDLTYGLDVETTMELEGGARSRIFLQVENGNPPVEWRLVEGVFPRGVRLDSRGEIHGAPKESGTFPVTLEASDAIGLEASAEVTLEVVAPGVGVQELAAPFLLTSGNLTPDLRGFLDWSGNRNGVYDLGDLRAHLQRNPDLPMTGELARTLSTVVVPVSSKDPGGSP